VEPSENSQGADFDGPGRDTVLRPHSAASFSWILLYLAAVGVINYILLYLVA